MSVWFSVEMLSTLLNLLINNAQFLGIVPTVILKPLLQRSPAATWGQYDFEAKEVFSEASPVQFKSCFCHLLAPAPCWTSPCCSMFLPVMRIILAPTSWVSVRNEQGNNVCQVIRTMHTWSFNVIHQNISPARASSMFCSWLCTQCLTYSSYSNINAMNQ